MKLWKDFKAGVASLTNDVQGEISKFKNNDFANASMAVCALIAAADGTIDKDERRKVAGFIQSSSALSVFDVQDLKKKFDNYCEQVDNDFDFGKVDLLQVVGKLKSKPEQARAVIKVGIIIGGADGDFDDDEKAVVREVCKTLSIPVEDFDLEA